MPKDPVTFVKNTQVLDAKQGTSKTFSALADSGAEVNIINRATVKRMELPFKATGCTTSTFSR